MYKQYFIKLPANFNMYIYLELIVSNQDGPDYFTIKF